MRELTEMPIRERRLRSVFFGPQRKHSWRRLYLISLAFFLAGAGLIATLVGQEVSHREFSANVLLRMGTEKSGIGARIYVKEGDLYLDYPDLVHRRRVPFWFLSNGLVVSVKAARDEEFNPGPADPLLIGFLLQFHPANPDHFCEEFRVHYIERVKVEAAELSGGKLSDLDLQGLKNLEKNFACEQTHHEIVANRDCRSYRFAAIEEYWTKVAFDPKLGAILQVEMNPPRGLVVHLDAVKEEPQPAALFVPPPDDIVLAKLR